MTTFHRGETGRTESPFGQIDYDKMLTDKLARARTKMKQYDLGAIVSLSDANIGYTTNIPPMGATAVQIGGNRYAILPIEGEPVAFEECDTAYHLRGQMKRCRIEFAIPAWGGPYSVSAGGAQEFLVRSFAEQIHSYLKEFGLDKEKIGIDQYVPDIVAQLQKVGLNVSLDGNKALLESRAIKTPEELECVRALATIIDGCHATLSRVLRPGVTEREVWAECVGYAINNGLTPDGGFIASGPHTWPKDISRQATDRKMRPGDLVIADFFNFGYFGYRSCYYRSYCVGPASKEVKEAYGRAYDWLMDAEKALKPGGTTRDVVEKWPDEVDLWSKRPPFVKSEQDKLSTFFNNMGHGIGLLLYEIPFFWRATSLNWPQKIETGMTVALETQESTPSNDRGVRIEEMIVVTDSGHEVISKWPAEEITELPLY